jgi:hypothetical protein
MLVNLAHATACTGGPMKPCSSHYGIPIVTGANANAICATYGLPESMPLHG